MIISEVRYAGFWIRVATAAIDSALLAMVLLPILLLVFKGEMALFGTPHNSVWYMIFNYAIPALVVIIFWMYPSATPGKMLTGTQIVDAKTGSAPSKLQCIVRYLGYYVSMFPLFMGILWVAFDKRKQGWHDKLAGTVVVIKG